jgi:hypothetical protein
MKVDTKHSNPTKFWNRLGLTVVLTGVIASSIYICFLVYKKNFIDQNRAREIQVEKQSQPNSKVEQYLKYSECLSEGGSEEKCNSLLKKQ